MTKKYHPCINCGRPAELHTKEELKECYDEWSKVMTLDGQIVDEKGEPVNSECLHKFNCLQEEQTDAYIMAYTYHCNICGEIRIEYQNMKTKELLDEYEIIKEGEL